MKNCTLLLAAIFTMVNANAQSMFFDAQYDVEVADTAGVYATNITVLPSPERPGPGPVDLQYRAYSPVGDDLAERPVVVINHTGSFLPPYANGGYTGSIQDSSNVYLASQLAARGFVVLVADYRKGWNPASTDQEVRTSTLLQAAYRGVQDANAMMRYIRKQYAEDGNPLAVDTSRIAFIGLGTGGYNVVNSNSLDRQAEVQLEKFIGGNGEPFIVPSVAGDVDGLDSATLNRVNHPGYSSDFDLAINVGGALGDSTWMEADNGEAPVIGLQAQFDPFAPFEQGAVIVPTTQQLVVNVAGGHLIVDRANRLGLNAALDTTNERLLTEGEFLTTRTEGLSSVEFETREKVTANLGATNFYPFTGKANISVDWIDSTQLVTELESYFARSGERVTAETLIANDRRTNANTTDPAGAKLNLDTIIMFALPRMAAALELGEIQVSTADLQPNDVALSVSPNPARTYANVEVASDVLIREVRVLNVAGQTIRQVAANSSKLELDVSGLSSGVHYLLLQTNRGTVAEQLVIE